MPLTVTQCAKIWKSLLARQNSTNKESETASFIFPADAIGALEDISIEQTDISRRTHILDANSASILMAYTALATKFKTGNSGTQYNPNNRWKWRQSFKRAGTNYQGTNEMRKSLGLSSADCALLNDETSRTDTPKFFHSKSFQ